MHKVTIRRLGKKRTSKKHWWIHCPLCKFRSHCNKSNWQLAIKVADQHIKGRKHLHRVRLLKGEQCTPKQLSSD
jgi:hypothetical protein